MEEEHDSGRSQDDYGKLPEVCVGKLTDHPNSRMVDALGHVVRRRILRAIQECEPPCSANDLVIATALDGESVSVVRYHADVLESCAAAFDLSGEMVTPNGFQSLYVPNVANDELVLWVLRETAAIDDSSA